jgi:hypothetical protein
MTRHLIRTLIITAAIAAVPTLSNAASPSATAMDGCVKAFMDSLAKHTVPLKLRDARLLNGDSLDSSVSEVVLTANDAHDNHTVGRAICHVNARGQVVSLEEVPAYSFSLL